MFPTNSAPADYGKHQRQDRDRREIVHVRNAEPACRDPIELEWCPYAHEHDEKQEGDEERARQPPCDLLYAFDRLHDEPTGSEKGIAHHEAEAAHQTEGVEPVE